MAFSSSPIASVEKTSGATSDAIDTTGADLLVIVLSSDDNTTPSDSKSNTWNALSTEVAPVSSTQCTIFYAENPTVGTSHTFTQNGASYGAIFVTAWSGADTTDSFDVESAGNNGNTLTSLNTGSATPSQDNSLIIAGLVTGKTTTGHTIDGSFTIDNQIDGATGVNYGGALAYLIQTTAGAENPTFSWTGSGEAAAVLAVFKPAAASTVVKDVIGAGIIPFAR